MNIDFRTDEYGQNFYIENEHGCKMIPYLKGSYEREGIDFEVSEERKGDILKINISIRAQQEMALKRLGFRLGIDCYMDKYPDWNEKYFPSALRCERNGFWSVFMSPEGKMISVCSPSKIVSWRNEYSKVPNNIVGHRIYTSSVEFVNTYPKPERHPKSETVLGSEPIQIELYYACPKTEKELYEFVKQYAGIRVPDVSKYTLEPGEKAVIDGQEIDVHLRSGVQVIQKDKTAEVSLYVRKDWFYYLDCARKSAERCQQKAGTHCESWYGFFSRVLYATVIKDEAYTRKLCKEFSQFLSVLTERKDGVLCMKEEALPNRLQNISSMISLLTDFYELTGDMTYLDDANDMAEFLRSLQWKDGSYRKGNEFYTCVIYPAKSMLELAIAEKNAGLTGRYHLHYESAYRAIKNLEQLLDDIATEGELTFEDGMISCESLQLGYLALQLPDGEEKEALTKAAQHILKKHRCLEQQFLPDCRVRGCTARFWEARYDLNFFANMMSTPHGWTSWKTYATYYLYMLTGNLQYLKDTMDTMGACMQCVDEEGILHWGYVSDPCIIGQQLKQGSSKGNIQTEERIIGESYLPMISDWWRQEDDEVKLQDLRPWDKPSEWDKYYGGSCDNDVHEHFKCLMETVFGKAFIHESENGYVTYNCTRRDDGFSCEDAHLREWVVFSESAKEVVLNGKHVHLKSGLQVIEA